MPNNRGMDRNTQNKKDKFLQSFLEAHQSTSLVQIQRRTFDAKRNIREALDETKKLMAVIEKEMGRI